MAASGLVTAFLGALQAAVAVLLTISYGVIAAQFGYLNDSSAKDISKLCVRMFLPALLITNVGSQLHLETCSRYVPILIWSLIYTLISLAIGFMATRVFKLPSWVTPAIAFNNTTSLPLLLIQSLEAAGILSRLLMSDGDTTAEAVKRANSYFLVCAIVGNSLTFALGPKLLDGEHVPDEDDRLKKPDPIQDCTDDTPNDVETGGVRDQGNHGGNQADADAVDEETSLLPDSVVAEERRLGRATDREAQIYWDQFPPWLQPVLDFLYAFINPPIIGAIIGAILGLVPPLHRAFFNETEDGGFFKAWLTTSVQNVGNLFAALQVVVVGSSLSNSLRRMKNGQDSGNIPLLPTLFVFAIRFIIWPLISIPIIWALAARTNLLGNDPVLWFSMCLMPTGPSALKLTALTQVNGSSELEKLTIAKFLTISYMVSPIICFAVVGSLKASEAAMA